MGEYACKKDAGHGNMRAALADAAFLTGLGCNADVVLMSSYAPLFTNPRWKKRKPNAIVFDNTRSYGTPAYFVQKLFANNHPDVVLPVSLPETMNAVPELFAVAGLRKDSGDLILKVVNRGGKPMRVNMNLSGATGMFAKVIRTELAAAALTDENTFEQPDRMFPKTTELPESESGSQEFAPYSVTVLRWVRK